MTIMEPFHRNRFELFHTRPQFRFMNWLIGVIFGYFMYKRDSKPSNSSTLKIVAIWLLVLGIMFEKLIYPLAHLKEKSFIEAAFYDSFGKILWAVSICVIIVLCERGDGGVINSFLSNPFWKPLSRLSYAMYLVSFAVTKWNVSNSRSSFTLDRKETVSSLFLRCLLNLSWFYFRFKCGGLTHCAPFALLWFCMFL